MLTTIVLLVFLVGFPSLVNWSEKRSKLVRGLSPIVICYIVGIILGNVPGISLDKGLLSTITGITVLLAIPLLLFSTHFMRMVKQAKPGLLAFFLGVVAVIVVSALAFLIFRGELEEPATASGMMIGVYTGGTPNMNAIGMALNVEEEVFILLNGADVIFSGIYLIILLTVGKKVLGLFLPRFNKRWNNGEHIEEEYKYSLIQTAKHVFIGLILSVITLGISIGISYLVMKDWSLDSAIPLIILGITTLGIAASFQPKIRSLPQTFSTANYLLLVFALAMGSLANFSELLAASSSLFLFCGFVVFGSVLLHYLLAYIFKIDRDTAIIASVAAIFGPMFIGPVAKVIGNKDLIAIGIALGLIGYAIGNYLGLGLAYVLN